MAERVHAVLGLFPTPGALLAAIPRVRALGALEAYTPYPVHGLPRALGLRPSPLGYWVLALGILGALAALAGQYWVSAINYPLVTGGKAPHSWEAFVPIQFEVTVLCATFTAGLGMLLLLNGLPCYGHPMLAARAMAAITRDRFALAVSGPDPEGAAAALAAAGATDLEVVLEPEAPPLTSRFLLRALGAVTCSCLGAGLATRAAVLLMPVLPPMVHMLDQPRLDAQDPSPFFADGRGMRAPAAGAVARGHLPGPATAEEAAALVNPLPRTSAVLNQGRRAFSERCALCHGALGDGHGSLTAAYGASPANLQSSAIRGYPDGRIFWVVTRGKDAMPGHEAELDEDQRWAVVHYLRALQRSREARDQDLGGAP